VSDPPGGAAERGRIEPPGPLAVVDGVVVVTVHVQPRASRAGLVGRHGDALKVAVTAAPVDGRANEAVARVLADVFGVKRRSVELRAGAQSREKRFAVTGPTLAEAGRILADLGALSIEGPHR
jgi:uncharacterized protein (TIGR00251 family)